MAQNTEKIAKLELWLSVENNSSFVRGKTKVRNEIEDLLRSDYNMKKTDKDSWDYKITIEYITEEDLEEQIEELFDEMHSIADSRNCYIEYDLQWKEKEKSW